MSDAEDRQALIEGRIEEALAAAVAHGAIGPVPMAEHVTHSLGFAEAALARTGSVTPARVADLGSGGGVPALILALWWEDAEFALIESQARRIRLLIEAVEDLDLEDRVTVHHLRAEDAGQQAGLRGTFDLVTARSFARPAITGECGAALLKEGGQLIVSEPPPDALIEEERWPAAGLAIIGLQGPEVVSARGAGFAVMTRDASNDTRYPRRPGVPERKPLW